MKEQRTFGSMLREKRLARRMTLQELSSKLSISLPYLSDMESNRRKPPDRDKLEQMMNVLSLSLEERQEMYDLAGKARDTVSLDLKDYIMDVDAVRMALRIARDAGTTPDEWLRFAGELQNKRKGGETAMVDEESK